MTVYSPSDDAIGEISDVVLSPSGALEAGVVDVGGFLGLGVRTVAIPLSQMSLLREADGDDVRVYVAATEAQLREMPEYEDNFLSAPVCDDPAKRAPTALSHETITRARVRPHRRETGDGCFGMQSCAEQQEDDMQLAPTFDAHGARIPVIGLGTWPMVGADCAAAVSCALRCGYRHIDTAQMYANEEAVGDGMRDSGVARDDVFLTTKIWRDDLAPDRALRATEASLKRLRVGAVDLLLVHWPDRALTAVQMVDALRACRDAGMTRHIGVSNFPIALLDAAMEAARRDGGAPLVANQCEYHPALDQSGVIAACRRQGMAFVSYSPLGKGALLETPVIAGIARAHARPPASVVLRWHVQQAGVVAIPKSKSPERIRANAAVFDFTLSEEEMRAIRGLARPDGRGIAPVWGPDWDAP